MELKELRKIIIDSGFEERYVCGTFLEYHPVELGEHKGYACSINGNNLNIWFPVICYGRMIEYRIHKHLLNVQDTTREEVIVVLEEIRQETRRLLRQIRIDTIVKALED